MRIKKYERIVLSTIPMSEDTEGDDHEDHRRGLRIEIEQMGHSPISAYTTDFLILFRSCHG